MQALLNDWFQNISCWFFSEVLLSFPGDASLYPLSAYSYPFVLVSSGFYHKLLQTSGLNSRNVLLIIVKAGYSEIRVPAGFSSGEGPLSGSKMADFLLYPHMTDSRQRKQTLFCLFF